MTDNNLPTGPTAIYYKTDLAVIPIKPANGVYFTLDEMQHAVGGRIEIIPLIRNDIEERLLVIHEEGKLIELPFNLLATLEWISYYGNSDYVSGDAIICHPSLIR